MFDGLFDHLEAHGTARFTLTGVKIRSDKDVVLIGKHAGHGNTAYLNAQRKLDAKRKARASGPMSDEEAAEIVLPMYAQTVFTGWEEVIGTDGKPMPATAANIEQMLRALAKKAPDIVGQAIAFFANPANFRDLPSNAAEQLGNG